LITKLENDIFKGEARLKEIEEMMMNTEFYKDPKKIKETNSEFGELKKKLNELYNKWEEEQYRLREIEELINES
jgi:protein subunit release factor A